MLILSVVSHGHGEMVSRLVEHVLNFPEVKKVILTLNIPENLPKISDSRIEVITNKIPKGFGANHNHAFKKFKSTAFCVLNPDIIFYNNPFPSLIDALKDESIGVVAPLVVQPNLSIEDSMRLFLTPINILRRIVGLDLGSYQLRHQGSDLSPDWVAGMFMLFKSDIYSRVNGFDERYFMYCEDADICTRIWKSGYKVIGRPSAYVCHDARRASRKKLNHFYWHLASIFRYFYTHFFSLPTKK
jgi:GT2 family glycosyltransferase